MDMLGSCKSNIVLKLEFKDTVCVCVCVRERERGRERERERTIINLWIMKITHYVFKVSQGNVDLNVNVLQLVLTHLESVH